MKLERNAKVCMGFLPMWTIPYSFYMYYLSVFLMECGINPDQIAVLMMVSNISALFCSFIASPIVDRMGRKNSTFAFDILSSAVPPLAFFLSQNFVVAIMAMAVSGANRIMSTGYYLLMIEDTSPENRMSAMNWFNIIMVVAGILTPIAGLLVSRLGLVRGEKVFLLSASVLMTAQAVARHFLVREPPTGERIMQERPSASPIPVLKSYGCTLARIGKTKSLLSAMTINTMVYAYYTIGTTISMFYTPYFSTFRNLSGVMLGAVGGVFSAGTLFSMLFINPHISKQNIYGYVAVSTIASLAGFLMLILCPQGNLVLLFASLALIALSYGVLKSAADALLAIEAAGGRGSGIYAVSFILSSGVSLVSIKILQRLYVFSPNWIFGLSFVLLVIVLLDCAVFYRSVSYE